MHRMSPEGECINAMTASLHGSFKRQMTEQNTTEPGSPVEQSQNTSDSVDPIGNSFTKSSSTGFAANQLVSPNGTNSVTSGIFSPTSQINSPVSNDTISSKSGVFSPISQTNKSEIFSPVSRSSPISGKNVFSPTSNQSIVSPMTCKDREKVMSPNTNTTSTTPSGRSRRSRHSQRKESRHYQVGEWTGWMRKYCVVYLYCFILLTAWRYIKTIILSEIFDFYIFCNILYKNNYWLMIFCLIGVRYSRISRRVLQKFVDG